MYVWRGYRPLPIEIVKQKGSEWIVLLNITLIINQLEKYRINLSANMCGVTYNNL